MMVQLVLIGLTTRFLPCFSHHLLLLYPLWLLAEVFFLLLMSLMCSSTASASVGLISRTFYTTVFSLSFRFKFTPVLISSDWMSASAMRCLGW